MHLVETQNLTYTYRDNLLALDGVNFIAEERSRIAVIGPNGAGKSTLFKHFNGILHPTSGEVLVRGRPITKENIREVRRFVGIVFQNPDDQIFSPTVEQDIAFGPTNLGFDEETVARRVEGALALLGIEDLRDRVPHHLSGGEKKRVAIAGILAMEPQVLVLDEPTAGLDPRGVADLVEFVNRLPGEHGMTVIFATHQVDIVAEIADCIYVMDRGRIVATGTVEEIFASPDLLARTRLDVPIIPKLIRSLQEDGIAIDMAYTYDGAKRSFIDAYTRRP